MTEIDDGGVLGPETYPADHPLSDSWHHDRCNNCGHKRVAHYDESGPVFGADDDRDPDGTLKVLCYGFEEPDPETAND